MNPPSGGAFRWGFISQCDVQNVSTLIYETCDYGWQKGLCNVIEVTNLMREMSLNYPGGPNLITLVPKSRTLFPAGGR